MRIQSKFMTADVRTTSVRIEGGTVVLEGRIKGFLPVRVEVSGEDVRELGRVVAGEAWRRAKGRLPVGLADWVERHVPVVLTHAEPPPPGFGLSAEPDQGSERREASVTTPSAPRSAPTPSAGPAKPEERPAVVGRTAERSGEPHKPSATGRALLSAARAPRPVKGGR